MATKPTPRRKTIRPVERHLVLKAKDGDDPVAVFSSSGKLLGIVDPSKITPVADPDADAKQPKPTRSAQTETAAGEDPQMGLQKARAAANQLKKQLYTSATTEEQNQLATAMNVAAADVLRQVQARRPRRRG